MIDTILTDLDGTLLPFEQEDFVQLYFRLVAAQMAPFGYAADDVVKAVWGGTKAMMKNDGNALNHDRFWDMFASLLGEDVLRTEATLDAFYECEFDQIRQVLRGESVARQMVDMLKAKGYSLVLATNPLFPEVAVRTRLAWVGLTADDFDHITHYANSRFCKPNVRYYEEILAAIGKTPSQCMMLGNNVSEDMVAEQLGMEVFFVNDFVENPAGLPTDGYRSGSLADCMAYLKTLPSVTA